jgi:hypothetical protein
VAVGVGSHFRERGSGFLGVLRRSWRVERTFTATDGQEHAIVVSADVTSTRKTLSVAVLLDRGRYEPLGGERPDVV